MLTCFIILLTWSLTQLIWLGILLFGFHRIVTHLGRGSLMIFLMLLMMKAAIFLGVCRDWLSWVSSAGSCLSGYLNMFLFRMIDSQISVLALKIRYGDMPAHNLLWRECEKSSGNVAARLAAIPLVQVISLLPGIYFYF